ncbi:MAG: hypothetical protein RRZ93_03155 [Ruthenibacterium sp.]
MKKSSTPTKWHKLDNTANIFPVVASRRMANVFRLTAVLRDEVEPALLQTALEETLPYFAAFNVRLRHGLFWNYFETNRATPHIHPEEDPPCQYLNGMETDRFLFRVLYFQRRIHLETFHALTDGTGAIRFLRAVCYRYFQLRSPEHFTKEQLTVPYGVEHASNIEDGYLKNYVPAKSATFREPTAFHIRAEKREAPGVAVTTALMPTAELKDLCHRSGASVGEYLTAALGFAVYEEYTRSNGATRPINIFVPVNLRRIFPSNTSTNFFSNITVALPMHGPDIPFDVVLDNVHVQFKEKCSRDVLAKKLAYTSRSENNIFARIIPLPLKCGILRIVFERSSNGSTTAFSNLGPVEVDPLFAPFFEGFRVLLMPTPKEPCKVSSISCGNTVTLTFASELEDDALARNVVRRLTAQGVSVVIESSESSGNVEAAERSVIADEAL